MCAWMVTLTQRALSYPVIDIELHLMCHNNDKDTSTTIFKQEKCPPVLPSEKIPGDKDILQVGIVPCTRVSILTPSPAPQSPHSQ